MAQKKEPPDQVAHRSFLFLKEEAPILKTTLRHRGADMIRLGEKSMSLSRNLSMRCAKKRAFPLNFGVMDSRPFLSRVGKGRPDLFMITHGEISSNRRSHFARSYCPYPFFAILWFYLYPNRKTMDIKSDWVVATGLAMLVLAAAWFVSFFLPSII